VAQFQVECVESTTEKDQSQYSRFVIESLERGQGTTVGNALRRVLLSNLGGSAVTAMRLAGVSHEFATIPGVREDVMDIILNVKQIVLRSSSAQPQIGRLMVQGPSMVTAGHIDLNPEVEVINPNQYIASLSPGSTLEMEFKIEQGYGYKTPDRHRDESSTIDFMQVDAAFMPVRKVNYLVEPTRGLDGKEKDRLMLDVWTNGSLTPQEALSQASSILVDLFNPLKDINFESLGIEEPMERPESQVPIEELQLSVRAYNCLKRAQINSVADLLDYSQEDLLEIKNFGQKSAEEVVEALQQKLGITLPQTKNG
jgi:DNA-directed RNA polymerase subunit alpha